MRWMALMVLMFVGCTAAHRRAAGWGLIGGGAAVASTALIRGGVQHAQAPKVPSQKAADTMVANIWVPAGVVAGVGALLCAVGAALVGPPMKKKPSR